MKGAVGYLFILGQSVKVSAGHPVDDLQESTWRPGRKKEKTRGQELRG